MTFNTSLYYQTSTDVFTVISEDSGETVAVSENESGTEMVEIPILKRYPINLAKNNRTGFEFTLSYNPTKKSRIFANFNLFNLETIGSHEGLDLNRTNLSWFSRINGKLTIFKDIDWQIQLFYRGPRETAISKFKSVFFSSMALNKDIFNKKGTLSIRATDLFNTARMRLQTLTNTLENEVELRRSLPSFNLSMTYRINEKKNQERKRSSANRGGNGDGGFDF